MLLANFLEKKKNIFNQPPFFRAPEYAAGQHSHVLTSSFICNNLKTKVGWKSEAQKNLFLFPRNSAQMGGTIKACSTKGKWNEVNILKTYLFLI